MSEADSQADPPPKDKRAREPERWMYRPLQKYRRPKFALEFRPGAAFFELADEVVVPRRTLLGYDRLYVFWQAIRNVALVPGAAAEVGSYRGGSAFFIASAFMSMTGEEAALHVFDTFEGHPAQAISEHDPFHTAGQFSGTAYDDVRDYLSRFARLQIHKGDVSASLPGLTESSFRLVHIDTDLYQPTLTCLQHFVPRMAPGGVIVIDDYASTKCPGVPKAVSEYLEDREDLQVWDLRTEQLVLVKR